LLNIPSRILIPIATYNNPVTLIKLGNYKLTQSFELEKVPSRLPARPWGWVSLGVGVAGLGAAVGLAALDDQQFKLGNACDEPDGKECPRLWNTQWGALGTAIAGASLTTLGVAILLNSAKRRTKKSAVDTGKAEATSRRPRFGVGFGSVTVRGRF